MSTSSTTGPWAEEPDNDARRIAKERRHHAKDAHWLTVEQALKIEGTTDATRLRMEIKQGLPCRFRHQGRWWVWKSPEEIAPLLAGRNPLDLVDARCELVVHEKFWRDRLGRSAAPAPPGDEPPPATETGADPVEPSTSSVQLRNAPETEIRNAIRAEYSETKIAGRKPPNINEIRPRVQERLKAQGFYASGRRIAGISDGVEGRRLKSGRKWNRKKEL
jgi:hypothetical protein